MRLILVSFFFFNIVTGQEKQTVTLFPETSESQIKIPFSGIEVVDARFDRSNIGTIQHKLQKQNGVVHKKIEINFPDSFEKHLPLLLERILSIESTRNEKLVILVKRFRLVDWERPRQSDPEMVLNFSFSFFSRNNDQYTKLGALDDVISEQLFVGKKKLLDETRSSAFCKLMKLIFSKQSWEKTGAVFSKEQFETGIQKRFQLPVFTDSIRRPGVYKTFNEFLNNNPSVIDINVTNTEKKFTTIKDGDGKKIDPADVWGASDGKDVYIVFRNTFYKMIPRDKSFIIPSFRSNDDQNRPRDYAEIGFLIGVAGAAAVYAMDNKNEFFYLNMENGKIFVEEIFGTSNLKEFQNNILKKQ